MKIKIYHGTTASKSKSIIGDGNFVFEERPDHWLGQGIYFFVNDYDAAVWWANQRYKNEKKAVIEYELEIDEGDLLDLDTLTGMRSFNEFMNKNKDSVTNKVNINNFSDRNIQLELRSRWLQLYYIYNDIKYSIFTFPTPLIDGYHSVVSLGLRVQERQIVVVDLSIINLNKIKIHFV
ncbi:hypothetical protein [Companilactobacillus jidongensis]|uniref:hypothetical protein n=1 Tax=Companilactobacillus jidongensis TaxID=2486006 RepID=UPI000F79FF46|nr:hypothetical protein [Companilactobacillus jidongensis]